jgi:hypothetical protein
MGRLVWIAAAGGAVALLPTGATAATGDRAGLALLDRVHRAYARVPAVIVSGRTGQLQFRFTLVLDAGITVGEEFFAESPSGVTQLVFRRGGPTYAHSPGASCWRPLASSDPQAFQNVGLPFPDHRGMRVGAPRDVSRGWLLPVTAGGDPGTFAVDKAGRVRSITVVTGGRRIFERVSALQSAPALVSPDPRC